MMLFADVLEFFLLIQRRRRAVYCQSDLWYLCSHFYSTDSIHSLPSHERVIFTGFSLLVQYRTVRSHSSFHFHQSSHNIGIVITPPHSTMKFSVAALVALLVADKTLAFAPQTPPSFSKARTSPLSMALDMPPAPEQQAVVVKQNSYGQPTDVRYSDFLTMVNKDRIEKITFSADGTQLLGVDVDGARLKIESLPNDPDLLTQLTSHKVRVCFRVEGNQDMLHAILVRMRSNNVFISNYFSG
jgi:hypothetical protein